MNWQIQLLQELVSIRGIGNAFPTTLSIQKKYYYLRILLKSKLFLHFVNVETRKNFFWNILVNAVWHGFYKTSNKSGSCMNVTNLLRAPVCTKMRFPSILCPFMKSIYCILPPYKTLIRCNGAQKIIPNYFWILWPLEIHS